jgi:hypothetical protein
MEAVDARLSLRAAITLGSLLGRRVMILNPTLSVSRPKGGQSGKKPPDVLQAGGS